MPVLSFFVFFILYAGAAFPSFGSDRAAELLAAAASNGVPPPPAQTAAWLLAKLALWFPLGNPAYRTNLFAAALMAGTVPMAAAFLENLAPPKSWAPFAHQELDQDRWRATALWLTAFLWGLSPGPWRCALSLGPDTLGLFLSVAAFRVAAAGAPVSPWATFLAALACGQWPAAAAALPGLALLALIPSDRRPRSPFTGRAFFLHGTAAAAGLSFSLGPLLLSRAAPLLDHGGPDTWPGWLRHAAALPPFFPVSPTAEPAETFRAAVRALAAAYTIPGVFLWLFGFFRLARGRRVLFQAALTAVLLPGPLLFAWTRPAPDLSDPAQAAAWGLCALGLSIPFLWGFHRTGVRFPAARTALALLLPLSLAGRLSLSARDDTALRDRAENVLKSLPEGALLWNPAAPGAVFHAQIVQGEREDVRVARRPDTDWGRTEFRRGHPMKDAAPGSPLAQDLFFLSAAGDAGPGRIFTDDERRLPEIDPATGLATAGRAPEDALPAGAALQFLPAESHRLASPAAQLSVARLPFWAARTGDPMGLARGRMALSRKFDQYGLGADAEEECLAALAEDPGQPDAHRRLGEGALARGDAARAAAHFRRALEREPRDAGLHVLLGRAATALKDRREAVDAFEDALRLDPSLEGTRAALAELLEEGNLWRAAAQHWRLLMDGNPQEKTYPWRLAKAEAAAGRPEQSRAALREYLMFPLSDPEKDEAESFEKSLGAEKPR